MAKRKRSIKARNTLPCPDCGSDTEVTEGRKAPGNAYRRRRRCVQCSARFTTYETPRESGDPSAAEATLAALRAILLSAESEHEVRTDE